MPQDTEFKYKIRIPWLEGDTISDWNDVCAYALENFGLPGDKFITHPSKYYMDFFFKNEVDAIHFSLACE